MIKAVGFDIGHTLIDYKNPLNWSSLYRPALAQVLKACGLAYSDEKIDAASSVLTKYNTRVNEREKEYSSDVIFGEILDVWHTDLKHIDIVKISFFSFFQAGAVPFREAEAVVSKLKSKDIRIGVLSDVPYGMDNEFALKDIDTISVYVDAAVTSGDAGFRKPNSAGFHMLSAALGVQPAEMLFVGDEEKDIVGANRAGMISALIIRSSKSPDFGQKYTIKSLDEIHRYIEL